jgi:5-methyltetrahydrofolate--homocysteine methyltransferase
MKNETKKRYLTQLNNHVVIFDGPIGTSLQALDLSAKDFGGEKYFGCLDYLNITHPEVVTSILRSFLNVGAEVIKTNTFRANRIALTKFGLGPKTEEINRQGAQLARNVADQFSIDERMCFVAGCMGPSGKLLSMQIGEKDEDTLTFDDLRDVFRQQALGLLAGGVDLFLIETAQDILEVKAAVHGILDAQVQSKVKLPIQAQVTLDTNGQMLVGTDIKAVLAILEGMEIDVIGINCSTGPDHMEPAINYLSQHSSLPISCIPNAGLPINKGGKTVFPLSPEDFAQTLSSFVDRYGISVVGGCCGTTPRHIELLAERIGRSPQAKRKYFCSYALSSTFHIAPLHQEPAPFIIGERLNTQGSRAFKRLMLANDFESAVRLGKEQFNVGAHALDVCTALTEDAKEAWRTSTLIRLLSSQIDLPLVIDTTDPDVMLAGLKSAPGRCLLNSINLEDGEEKAKHILSIAKKFNAALIALTIDESGMAATAQRKLDIAQRIFHLAVDRFGLDAHALIFDPLTFSLASGSQETADAGRQTLEALRLIKKTLPDTYTVLGISNISFGLDQAGRKALNSVFLRCALQAGLDLAILNPLQITPYTDIPKNTKMLAEDLILNRSSNALKNFVEHFQTETIKDEVRTAPRTQVLSISERIRSHILSRDREYLIEDIDTFIQEESTADQQKKALETLNTILLPAMQEVGDQFASGDLILPFVLQSAEIMQDATNHIETYLETSSGGIKGCLVLATVYGDVHDIGKNLVKTIVSNNGYTVIDLGKQVPAETIINKAVELNADAIGLSALLVSTSQQMPLIVNLLHKQNIKIPVLIGGAAVNRDFAERIRITENGSGYAGGVTYCKDAFDALKILSKIKTKTKLMKTQLHNKK